MSNSNKFKKTPGSKSLSGSLFISDIELEINIGVSAKERSKPQTVFVDIKVNFIELPKGTFTDDYNEVVCYSKFIRQLKSHLENIEFNLIEYLSLKIHEFTSTFFDTKQIEVSLTKRPIIEKFNGFVRFTII